MPPVFERWPAIAAKSLMNDDARPWPEGYMSVETGGYERRFARAQRTSRGGQHGEKSDPAVTGAAEDENRSGTGPARSLGESLPTLQVAFHRGPNTGVESR